MLILSRRWTETVRIGDEIIIRVVEIRRGLVRLGIEAPMDVICHRGEIFDRIREERKRREEADP